MIIAADIKPIAADFDIRVALDVTDNEACRSLAREVSKTHGAVSIIVNAAGLLSHSNIEDDDYDDTWRQVFSVNVDGSKNVIRAFADQIIERRGRVINLASTASVLGSRCGSAYAASKHAIAGLTKSLALEFGKAGVRVNALAPGRIETPMTAHYRDVAAAKATYLDRTALGRYGRVEDIVGPFLFLASAQSAYVTGIILAVDGGYIAN